MQTPPGVLALLVAVLGLGVTTYFGIRNSPASGPDLEATLDFAVASRDFSIKPSNSAIVLRLTNRGPTPVQIAEITTNEGAIEPLPPAELNSKTRRYKVLHVSPRATIGSHQGTLIDFASKTLLAFKPTAIEIELATGERTSIDLRPYISALRCAGIRQPRSCYLSALPASINIEPIPHLVSKAGIPALYPKHEHRRVPAKCRDRHEFAGDDPCLRFFLVKATLLPTPGKPIGWHDEFP